MEMKKLFSSSSLLLSLICISFILIPSANLQLHPKLRKTPSAASIKKTAITYYSRDYRISLTSPHSRVSLPHHAKSLKITPKQQLANNIPVSYADVAASGPKQSPEDAAAPQPPTIVTNETASTSSLVDVDMPSVHTVPADFLDQDVQTETQADRQDREAASKRAKAEKTAKEAKHKAKKADSWIVSQFASLTDGSAGALAIANVLGVVGLSGYLGYKGWGLYERGRLSWENVGLGVGIMAAVGVVEGVFGQYLYRGQKKSSS